MAINVKYVKGLNASERKLAADWPEDKLKAYLKEKKARIAKGRRDRMKALHEKRTIVKERAEPALPSERPKEEILKEKQKKIATLGFAGMIQEEQARILAMMEKHGVDPLDGLLRDLNNSKVSAKEKIAIRKFLLPYVASKRPELKAVDVQQDVKMNVSISINSFRGMNVADTVKTVELVPETEYLEFMDESLKDGEMESTIESKLGDDV